MAKIEIPDSLKADIPQTLLGRIMSATPIVMTVVATMLAGLASSEMTQAQYDRSLAAQQQSKAGDQWSFFQAKRQRSAFQHGNLDQVGISHAIRQIDPLELKAACATTDDAEKLANLLSAPSNQKTFSSLQRGELPALPDATPLAPDIKAFDAATKPVNQLIESINDILARQAPSQAKTDFIAARMRFAAQRYDAEARLNQVIANLYELQVRKNNLSAERHHQRSKRFFFGMLGAQMAVIISTFAIAARKRNLLWTLATAAGVTALLFAGWVYLYV